MLTGKAKTDYQRAYMRRRRSNRSNAKKGGSNAEDIRPLVRPEVQHTRPMMERCLVGDREGWKDIPVPDDYDLDEALSHPLPDFDADGNLIPEIE